MFSFDFNSSVYQKETFRCTREKFNEMTDSALVARVASNLQTFKGRLNQGEITKENYDELCRKEKNKLPAVLWHASFQPAVRNNANAHPSGLGLLDIDHCPAQTVEEVRKKFYTTATPDVMCHLGIVFAGYSIRKEGLHIVFVLKPGETLEEGQQRIAHTLHLQDYMDTACKDLQRPCFVSPRNYVWYVDEERLWGQEAVVEGQEAVDESREPGVPLTLDPRPRVESQEAVAGMTATEPPTFTEEDITSFPDSYGDIPYQEIVDEWIRSHGGYPVEGVRHNFLLGMSKAFAPICENNPEWLYTVLPQFSQRPSEVISMCRSTCQKNYQLSNDMKCVLTTLQGKKTSADQTTILTDDELKDYPRALRISLKSVPSQHRFALLVLLLPICAMYATDAKVRHLSDTPTSEGAVMPLNLFGVALAPTSGGKKALNEVMEQWLRPQRELDNQAVQLYKDWKQLSAAEREKTPEPPRCKRVLGVVSVAALAQKLDHSNGQCVLIQSNEAAEIAAEANSGAWANIDKPLLKAFDEAYWDRDRVSADSVSVTVKAHMCLSVTGTYSALSALLGTSGNAFENGFANRLMLAELPFEAFAIPPHYHEFTAVEVQAINDAIERLRNARGEISMPQTRKAIWNWVVDKAREAASKEDLVMDQLRKRCAAMAMRCATLFHIMEGTGRESVACQDFAIRMADLIFECQLKLFGDAIAEVNKKQNAARFSLNYCTYQTPTNDDLLDRLPDEFNIDDVYALKPEVNRESIKTIVCRWRTKGLVKSAKRGKYQKTA